MPSRSSTWPMSPATRRSCARLYAAPSPAPAHRTAPTSVFRTRPTRCCASSAEALAQPTRHRRPRRMLRIDHLAVVGIRLDERDVVAGCAGGGGEVAAALQWDGV